MYIESLKLIIVILLLGFYTTKMIINKGRHFCSMILFTALFIIVKNEIKS
jgi:hypothetical protein